MWPASARGPCACVSKSGGVRAGSAGYEDDDIAESQLARGGIEYEPVDDPDMDKRSPGDEAAEDG